MASGKNDFLCFNMVHLSSTTQFVICSIGVFFFFLLYGYFQELIFVLDEFRPYGWYLTFIQFCFYTIFGFIETNLRRDTIRKIPFKVYIFLALLTVGTMGFSNASLGHLNYPTQVIFKCCKLIPVLVGSSLIQGKRYTPLDYLAAFLMCIGLIFFILADSKLSPMFDTIDKVTRMTYYVIFLACRLFGWFESMSRFSDCRFYAESLVMISTALLFDALIGNVQEKEMKKHNASNAEIVFYSYFIGVFYILLYLIASGDFVPAFQVCLENKIKTYGYGFVFSLTGYVGIQIVLQLVRTGGAFAAVTVTTCRKAVSIVISFLVFSKPFTSQYVYSGLLVVLGIYINMYSKKNPDFSFPQAWNTFLQKLQIQSQARQVQHRRFIEDV